METMHDRLKEARKAAGYTSASAAARALGISSSTYAAHENGQNGFKADDAERYARMFRVDSAWILFGNTRPEAVQQVPDAPRPGQSMAERIAWYWTLLSSENQEVRSVLSALLQTLEKQDGERPPETPGRAG